VPVYLAFLLWHSAHAPVDRARAVHLCRADDLLAVEVLWTPEEEVRHPVLVLSITEVAAQWLS
jgi:uncharacterized membrane protein